MKVRKKTLIIGITLTIAMLPSSIGFAQGWGEVLLGVGSALLGNYIDNSSNYSNEVKQSMKNDLNTINNSINANQNAANATRDACNGNYTGAVIQGAQTFLNTTGNYQYDTYLKGPKQKKNANRQYNQDIQNGMDRKEALDKRNTTIGNSTAESVIELQDRIARERAEKARQQRESERQSWENNNYYSEPSYYETTYTKTSTSIVKSEVHALPQKSISKNRSFNNSAKTLSSTNAVVFLTDRGENVFLSIPFRYHGESISLSYKNDSDKAIRLSCNRASAKVKYYGDNLEQTFTGACSFVMPAHSENKMEWSDVFPNLSNMSSIESIKVLFVDTQITDENELINNENSGNNINSNSIYSNDNNNSNSGSHLLTKNRIVKLFTDDGSTVALGIDQSSGRLFYNNMYNDRDIKLNCNKVNIKVKYVGDDYEQTITDACSFVMHANTYDYLDWSDVFFSISETKVIESIKVLFEETQIK